MFSNYINEKVFVHYCALKCIPVLSNAFGCAFDYVIIKRVCIPSKAAIAASAEYFKVNKAKTLGEQRKRVFLLVVRF